MPYIKITYLEMESLSIIGNNIWNQEKYRFFAVMGVIGGSLALIISSKFPRYENVLAYTHL